MDKAHDGHGVANQMAKLEQKARERGWTVVYRLSDNDIGVTRKDPTKPGKYRPGYEEAMRLVDARAVDAVLCFKWDRFIREPLDLEYLIPRFDKAGVRFAEVDGNIDLGTDSGRLHARILIAVAKAEQERKAERQKLANEQAAINGKRFTGRPAPVRVRRGPRDRPPGGGPGGRGGVRRAAGRRDDQRDHAGVDQAGADAAAAGPARHHPVEPDQHPQHPAEPEDRGAVGLPWGDRRPRAVGAAGAARRRGGRCAASWKIPPASRRAGCGRCWAGWRCARAGTWSPGCRPIPGTASTAALEPTRDRVLAGDACGAAGGAGGGVHQQAGRRAAVPRGRRRSGGALEESGPDVVALREEAAAIRRNLEEMAADRALGLITRPQMLAATGRANLRLDEIGAELDHAARENVLAPLVAAENAAACGRRWTCQPPARGHQDADGGHAALAGPGRPPPVRPGHGPPSPGSSPASRLTLARVQGVSDGAPRTGV